ncbi:hypothetical protein RRF57_012140 [Xylaria bambusicola]|uniref:Uncharacterized protein n=1 Tax=Xylaria bambusicola TaxID=326684 RepID=A0AAN7ZEJ5_9PEZI
MRRGQLRQEFIEQREQSACVMSPVRGSNGKLTRCWEPIATRAIRGKRKRKLAAEILISRPSSRLNVKGQCNPGFQGIGTGDVLVTVCIIAGECCDIWVAEPEGGPGRAESFPHMGLVRWKCQRNLNNTTRNQFSLPGGVLAVAIVVSANLDPKGTAPPSVPLGNGECISAYVGAMTRNRLSTRNELTVHHNDILPLIMRSHSRPAGPEGFSDHDYSATHASGDEKDNTARAVAVPQMGSLSFVSMYSLSLLLKRAVLREQ